MKFLTLILTQTGAPHNFLMIKGRGEGGGEEVETLARPKVKSLDWNGVVN